MSYTELSFTEKVILNNNPTGKRPREEKCDWQTVGQPKVTVAEDRCKITALEINYIFNTVICADTESNVDKTYRFFTGILWKLLR